MPMQTNYQSFAFRQPSLFKIAIYLLILSIATFAGSCAGMLCSYFVFAFFQFKTINTSLCVGVISLLAMSIWLLETVRVGMASSAWKSGIFGLFSTIILSFSFRDPVLLFLIFFLLYAVIVAAFCFLGSNLALALLLASTNIKKRYLKIAVLAWMIPFSFLAAFLIGSPPAPNEAQFFNHYPNLIRAAGASLIPLLVANMSWRIFVLDKIPMREFAFFQEWAIALAAWGGKSFHNKDLSNADFTGATVANTDFRASSFYRTCLKDVKGLDKARVDSQYLDLDNPNVQKLLTQGTHGNHSFSRVNLRGAYLSNADMRQFVLIETNLEGADLSGADLRESILLRAILTDADLSRADLTGACLKDWSFNAKTRFDDIACDYYYRDYEDNRPTDRYPAERDFEPGEFQSLFQKLSNAVELVFKDQVDWRALSFTFEKFRVEDGGLELELKGVEQQGDYWIVKVAHKEGVPRQEVERKVAATYDDIRLLLEAKDQEINRLVGINTQMMSVMENQTSSLHNQSEALKNYSKQPLGNSFFITGSTITNLTGSGQIEYAEAVREVRNAITLTHDPAQMDNRIQQILEHFQSIATMPEQQAELIEQLVLSEAGSDPTFKKYLQEQSFQILQAMPQGVVTSAIQNAIAQL